MSDKKKGMNDKGKKDSGFSTEKKDSGFSTEKKDSGFSTEKESSLNISKGDESSSPDNKGSLDLSNNENSSSQSKQKKKANAVDTTKKEEAAKDKAKAKTTASTKKEEASSLPNTNPIGNRDLNSGGGKKSGKGNCRSATPFAIPTRGLHSSTAPGTWGRGGSMSAMMPR